MKIMSQNCCVVVLAMLCIALLAKPTLAVQGRQIPDALKPWESWATWNERELGSPSAFNNANDRISFWPSQLSLSAEPSMGKWKITIHAFSETWVPLPGSQEIWPLDVVGNGQPVAVVERQGIPAVKLQPGRHELSGEFRWDRMPQKIRIPKQIGLLTLTVDGKPLPMPNWDAGGNVWLKRVRTEAAEKNLLAVQVYRVIEDGIPGWLRTEIELTVSGKSREEEFGWILPEGWKLTTVESQLPVAVDEQGRMKAQVRSGKWTVMLHAFRADDAREIKFAESVVPIIDQELVAFRSRPEFRLAEVTGVRPIDVSQTTFPEKWRSLPVFQWDTSTAIGLDEKTRGMGLQRPSGLTIDRQLWLDEDGKGVTYRDSISGQMQQTWRLDSAEGQQPGSVRIDGKGQLITASPTNGSAGVEIRTRNLDLDAIGRITQTDSIQATGWQTDADSLSMTINMPPGWRMLALFGADNVTGDWLTTWTLLDLFLLLIFSLAVCRIWGIPAGIVAFLAFGLAYHEPASPRLTWFFLLIPLALLKVVPNGKIKWLIGIWKYVAIAVLVINLAPFLTRQIQTALYPQLERPGISYGQRSMFPTVARTYHRSAQVADWAFEEMDRAQSILPAQKQLASKFKTANLAFDPKARIQTGPAAPDWSWNQVRCYWSGPVDEGQEIRPILITLNQHRILTAVRIVLLALLAIIFFGGLKLPEVFARRQATAASALILLFCLPGVLHAQEIPDANTLKTLRERLLETPDAFPHAAEIPAVDLKLDKNRITMDVEVHTAVPVAVPLPGKLPTWSPVSVSVDGKPAELVCRKEGYLWTVLPVGVHHVIVESLLPDVSEWEWNYLLKPRTVSINAEGWTVTGLRPNGVPESQVFFARERREVEGTAAYDRKDFSAIVAVDRHLETGLIWQVRNEVTRLSPGNKAISIKVPLLPGESVLTAGAMVKDGQIEVRIGGGQDRFSWTSELPVGTEIKLLAPETDQWVERWHLVTSPVWSLTHDGLGPVFSSDEEHLVPVWHPWPGEAVKLSFGKPQPVAGDTVTIQRVNLETDLGYRDRQHDLKVELECSLGNDFLISLDSAAEVSAVKVSGQAIPVRRDNAQLIVPVQPGRQSVEVSWKTNEAIETVVNAPEIGLPVASANITSEVNVPESRWILWTEGPTRGPAVQLWVILAASIIAALVLGSFSLSPLNRFEWVLLAIGLTQVHIAAALVVVAWLFLLAWRGKADPAETRWWVFNLRQVFTVLLTVVSLGILIVVVGEGLLGHPDMFIYGNGSWRNNLQWFQPKVEDSLPATMVVSTSVWFYRLFMLFWALWLASALLRWLKMGWNSFSHGGFWRGAPRTEVVPEVVAETDQ